jgi:hypothetical protein
LINGTRRTIAEHHYMLYENYEVMNASAAVAQKFLDPRDIDCAVSEPNALHSKLLSNKTQTTSIVRSNATALKEAGLSEFFDFISFNLKPLTIKTEIVEYDIFLLTRMIVFADLELRHRFEINSWRIEDGKAKDVRSLPLGFYLEGEPFPPFELEPRSFVPGWVSSREANTCAMPFAGGIFHC